MKYTYTCKKIPLSDSIKTYAEKRLEKLEKYFHREDTSALRRSPSGMGLPSCGRRPRSLTGICGALLMPP